MTQLSVHTGGTEILPTNDFRWPDGKRLGVFFRVAFEGWEDGAWPGIGPMGNPLKPGYPDLNAIGFAEYGPRRGIWRALDTLGDCGVKATILVCGVMAERYPDAVRAISDAGHDVVAHSYAMNVMPVYLSEEDERANIRRTADLIEGVTGKRPTGWISPRGTPSPRTARLLIDEGFTWHGDSLNHDLPYVVKFDSGSIVSFSSNMECNDLPLSLRYGNPPSVMVDIFEDWLEYARHFEKGAARIDPTVHSHVFGRPTGMSAFRKILDIATHAEDIWIGTRSEVATLLLKKV